MKNLIFTETDKFTSKTTIKSLKMEFEPELCILVYINYRYVSAPEGEAFLVDVETHTKSMINLKDGELIFNINDTKNVRLKAPHDNGHYFSGGWSFEEVSYVLKKEELLDICEAQKIEIGVYGAHTRITLTCNELIIETARAMYNAIYDSSMYVEEVQKAEEKRQAEKQAEIEQKEQAAKKNETSNIMAILAGVSCTGGLITAFLAICDICPWIIPIICFIIFILSFFG